MKKITSLILLGACTQLFAADYIYVNSSTTGGSTLTDSTSWYDYAWYPTIFQQSNTVPGVSDNIHFTGYDIVNGTLDDGSDSLGTGARPMYRPQSSLLVGGDMAVNNFNLSLDAGYLFRGGASAGIFYLNGKPGDPIDFTVNGTMNISGSHGVTINNGFKNLSIGTLTSTSTGNIVISDGIQNLYLGTDSSGVANGTTSTVAGNMNINMAAGSTAYIGNLTTNGSMTFNANGDTYVNGTFIGNGTAANPYAKQGTGLIYFKDYTSSRGFVMYSGTLSADSFKGQIQGRGGNWTNLNLYSNNSNYGDTDIVSNWTNVTIEAANGQFNHYAGKIVANNVVVKGGTTFQITAGGNGNFTDPARHPIYEGDLLLQGGSKYLQSFGTFNGGTLTIEDGGSFSLQASTANVNDAGATPEYPAGAYPVTGTFKGDLVMTGNSTTNSTATISAGDFQGNINITNASVPTGTSTTLNLTGGNITGIGGAKAQINVVNGGNLRGVGGTINADINFHGKSIDLVGSTLPTFVSGSSITSKVDAFNFRHDTSDLIFDGTINLSGTGNIPTAAVAWINAKENLNIKEINLNGGYGAGRSLDGMMTVSADKNLTLGKLTFNNDAGGVAQYMQVKAGQNGNASGSVLRIDNLEFNGATTAAAANDGSVFATRLMGGSGSDYVDKISIGNITGTGYIQAGKYTNVLLRYANHYEVDKIEFDHRFAFNQAENYTAGTTMNIGSVILRANANGLSEINGNGVSIGLLSVTNNETAGSTSGVNILGIDYLNVDKVVFGTGTANQLEQIALRSDNSIYIKEVDMGGQTQQYFMVGGRHTAAGNADVRIDKMHAEYGTVFATGGDSFVSKNFSIGALTGSSATFTTMGTATSNLFFTIGDDTNKTYTFSGRFNTKGHNVGNNSVYKLTKVGTSKQILNGDILQFKAGIDVQDGHLVFRTSEKTKLTMNGGRISATVNDFAVDTLSYNDGDFYFDLLDSAFAFRFDSLSDLTFESGSVFGADNFIFANMAEFADGFGEAILFKFSDAPSTLMAVLQDLLGESFEYTDAVTFDKFLGTFGYDDTFGEFYIEFALIPEPSTYAAIFGALALALAIYRRRK